MILHLLTLMRWEWFKLRRRWLPWVLLIIFVLFTQMIVWIPYFSFRVEATGDNSFFVLPDSVTSGLSSMFGIAIVLMIILASSVTGTEYGWGTLRTIMPRGPGRWQFLVAKFGVLALAGLGALVIATIAIGISSLVTSGLAENGSDSSSSGEWSDAALTLIKAAYALVPYALLATALTVFTSSATFGMAITFGYHVVEQIAVPVMTALIRDSGPVMAFALGVNVNALVLEASELGLFFLVTSIPSDYLPGTTQAFLVLLAYSAIFAAAALWLFQRRDITGAKGT